jgi:hypothetical protein
MNPLWELAFRMPPEWYGGMRSFLSHVLDKLERRKLDLRKSTYHYLKVGYLASLELPPRKPCVGVSALGESAATKKEAAS